MTDKNPKEWYHLPKGEYNSTFLKALAIVVHLNKLDPTELQYWFNEGWSQAKMAKEMYDRVKAS